MPAVVKLAAGFAVRLARASFRGAHNALDIGASALTYLRCASPTSQPTPIIRSATPRSRRWRLWRRPASSPRSRSSSRSRRSRRIRDGGAAVDVDAFAIGAILLSIAVDLLRWRALDACGARNRRAMRSPPTRCTFRATSSPRRWSSIGLAATRAGYRPCRRDRRDRRRGFHRRGRLSPGPARRSTLWSTRAPTGLAEAVRARSSARTGRRGDRAFCGFAAAVPGLVGDLGRLGLAHAAARARRRDQGRSANAHRAALARGRSHHHRQSARARRRNDPRAGVDDREPATSVRCITSPSNRSKGASRHPRSRSRSGDAARRRP